MNERLQMVIDEVKYVRVGNNCPWIYKDGKIKDNIIIADILPILEELDDYMAEYQSADTISYILNNYDYANNSYNWCADITNDFQYYYIENKDNSIDMIFQVHLGGDIRGNYSDYILLHFDNISEFFELNNVYQNVDIVGTNYMADINIFQEGYYIYDIYNDNEIGYFYDLEVEDLLKSIEF